MEKERIYLKKPSLEDKESYLELVYDLHKKGFIDALGYQLDESYENWLKKINDEELGINLENDRVPRSRFFIMKDNEVIGTITIRHKLNTSYLNNICGHIGYAIKSNHWNKGYATKALDLAMNECLNLGIETCMISCEEKNIASKKVIETNGGVLNRIYYDAIEEKKYLIYYIDVLKRKKFLRK